LPDEQVAVIGEAASETTTEAQGNVVETETAKLEQDATVSPLSDKEPHAEAFKKFQREVIAKKDQEITFLRREVEVLKAGISQEAMGTLIQEINNLKEEQADHKALLMDLKETATETNSEEEKPQTKKSYYDERQIAKQRNSYVLSVRKRMSDMMTIAGLKPEDSRLAKAQGYWNNGEFELAENEVIKVATTPKEAKIGETPVSKKKVYTEDEVVEIMKKAKLNPDLLKVEKQGASEIGSGTGNLTRKSLSDFTAKDKSTSELIKDSDKILNQYFRK